MLLRIYIFGMDYINIVCVFRIYIFGMDYINIVCVVSNLHIWDGLHKHSMCCFEFTYLGWITLT